MLNGDDESDVNWPKDSIFGEVEQNIKISQLNKRISELYVVIDTLQTNLRSAVSYLEGEEKKAVENHSFKWCMGWKPGDEKN